MILTATDSETAAFGWTYVASAVGFVLAVGVFCAVSVWLLDRVATRKLRRHVNRALDRGDQQILRAVTEREQAHRERVTVPRRLTDRSHR